MSQRKQEGLLNPQPRAWWALALLISGYSSAVLGAVVVFGWHLRSVPLLQVHPNWAPMQYNTALGFLLAGIGLVATNRGWSRLALGCAAGVGAFGGLTLIEYSTGLDLGIDELFMNHYVTVETSHPGRMAPNTALCFLLVGSAVAAASWARKERRPAIAGLLGCLVFGLGVVAFFGYSSGLQTAYGWGALTRMAVHTAAGFVVIGFGLFCHSLAEEMSSARRSAPWVAVALGLAVLTVFTSVWQALVAADQAAPPGDVGARSVTLRGDIETALSAEFFVLWVGLACALLVGILVRQVQRAREAELRVAQAARELQHSHREVLHSNEALERFAYVVSHDLKEPLRMVSAYTQLLASEYEGKLDRDADKFIGFAVDGAQRMMAMIEDVLAYSRISPDRRVPEPSDVKAAVDSALKNLQLSVQESDARVRCRASASVLVEGGQLSQLFQNLIGNALKFRGSTPPEIDIDAQAQGKMCIVSVRDNGSGIARKHHRSVFEVFEQVEGKHKTKGTGIGLALCQRIVEQHGGRIWVESELGQGATFRFSVPIAHAMKPARSLDGEQAA